MFMALVKTTKPLSRKPSELWETFCRHSEQTARNLLSSKMQSRNRLQQAH
jgi:hypothetical protein